ncbi:MAG: hypothetical protein J6N67_03885 [Desulfovibrio sp.]|jgi:hypothetical protein|uniref:hypothetical protein n=1 Tax=uncultured Desulfovibrio sp. TaxID=167968 RepID=UPI001B24152F|nr:hypothetical protein [uncultured Desulfovibrio sp.]MBE6440999.1 hypothetical protein [Desulfovibrio desulfuricans]MBO5491227.1 hypothetical protein [Desulfovibrio sp.]MBO6171285.1 hypothetical protein [Desulfovibrio sp.]
MNIAPELHMAAVMSSPYARNGAYRQAGLNKYKRQLAETRTTLFQIQALKLLSGDADKNAEARREFILKRVTREFWTNFVVRGEETGMLLKLQSCLREEFGDDLQFFYPPGDTQMIILHEGEHGPEPVAPGRQACIINRAWQIARDLVAEHMC